MKAFINGVKLVEKTGDDNNIYDTSIPLRLGAATNHPARTLLGRIAQALVYEKSLSDAEVLQNFEVTKSRFGL